MKRITLIVCLIGLVFLAAGEASADALLGVTPDDLEGLVDVPRGVEGVQVGLLFRKTTTGEVKISLRSNGPVDVNEIARRFGGGGHVKASGAMVAGPMERAMDEVLAAAREAVAKAIPEGATD